MKLLVINPNSSEKVTENLSKTVSSPEGVELVFYTGPESAPREIVPSTSCASEQAVLPDLVSKGAIEIYDGFLVCCYSEHPLVGSLQKLTSKPVLGIMQATLLYGLSVGSKSVIITSVSEWNEVLDTAITDFVGSSSFPSRKFAPTRALDVSVLSLSDPEEFKKIENRVDIVLNKEYADENIKTVLLGCAGMAGLDEKLSAAFEGVVFVDSVKVGVELLASLCRFRSQLHP
ncbi:hypothetical protein G9P44_003953 [Scheffersomyces stipitis]|nr:hypothetical protein G9P44_003953 [Scheffersomyces stipitis]